MVSDEKHTPATVASDGYFLLIHSDMNLAKGCGHLTFHPVEPASCGTDYILLIAWLYRLYAKEIPTY